MCCLFAKIWGIICKKLSNLDSHRLILASSFFRNLQLKRRVEFLSQPVFEIVFPKLIDHEDQRRLKETPDTSTITDDLTSMLCHSRLICKTWRNTIDNMALKGTVLEYQGSLTPFKPTVHNLLASCYHFQDASEILAFMKKFGKSHSSDLNPIIGSCVSIDTTFEEEENELAEYVASITGMMKTFGSNIWKLSLSASFDSEIGGVAPAKIVKWLQLLRNLRTLQISCLNFGDESAVVPVNIFDHFPILEHLKNVIFNDVSSGIVKGVLTKNPNIGLLKVFRSNDVYIDNMYLSQLHMLRNLQCLCLDMHCLNDYIHFGKLRAPLRVLRLNYVFKEYQNFLNWGTIFSYFSEANSGSLEELYLDLPKAIDFLSRSIVLRDSLKFRLKLSKLKKLELRVENVFSIDFALDMKNSLEELIIRPYDVKFNTQPFINRSTFNVVQKKQIVQYIGYEKIILVSNIWSIFPKLQSVKYINQTSVTFERCQVKLE